MKLPKQKALWLKCADAVAANANHTNRSRASSVLTGNLAGRSKLGCQICKLCHQSLALRVRHARHAGDALLEVRSLPL